MYGNVNIDRTRRDTIPQNASWLKVGMQTPDGSRVQSVDIWQDADRVDIIWASNGHLVRSNYKRNAQISILD